MSRTLISDNGSRPVSMTGRAAEQPEQSSAAASGQLPEGLAKEVEVPWLTRLQATTDRCNIRCLPVSTRIAKRLLDIVGATVLLVLSLPILLLAAAAVKLTSPGPVLFLQTRVGLNERRRTVRPGIPGHIPICRRRRSNFGRPFTIYKLRTMYRHSDQTGPRQAVNGDARVTRVGRFLRKTRIDELPQLVNVLKGEMSLVGPRPECIEYMEKLTQQIPDYLQRLGLKPGLTGIAQIENGYANDLSSYQRKVAFDLLYLRHCCLVNDLKILLRTVKVVLTGFGAL